MENQQHQQDVERVAEEIAQGVADNSQSEVADGILDAMVSDVAPAEVAAALGETEEELGEQLDGVDGE